MTEESRWCVGQRLLRGHWHRVLVLTSSTSARFLTVKRRHGSLR